MDCILVHAGVCLQLHKRARVLTHLRLQVLFSIVLPEVSMRGNTIQPSLQDRTCTGSAVADGAGVVVSCQYDVSAERASAFSRTLLEQVHPGQVSCPFERALTMKGTYDGLVAIGACAGVSSLRATQAR